MGKSSIWLSGEEDPTRKRRPREEPAGPRAEQAEVLIDAALVAPHLGISPRRFMVELRRGYVYQTTERGIGEHNGRYRITFLYRTRKCRIIVGPNGNTVVTS
jgi:hypothetical protein